MKPAIVVIVISLASCAVTTGVVSIGGDNWSVTHRDKGPIGSLGALRSAAYREASAFCSAKGKQVQILRNNDTPRSLGEIPEAQIEFTCVDRPRS